MQRLDTRDAEFDTELARLTEWDEELDAAVDSAVAEIISEVRRRGDAALLEYTARFDRLQAADLAELEVSVERQEQALAAIDPERRRALEFAAQRVRSYHEHQFQASWDYTDESGNRLGQKITIQLISPGLAIGASNHSPKTAKGLL